MEIPELATPEAIDEAYKHLAAGGLFYETGDPALMPKSRPVQQALRGANAAGLDEEHALKYTIVSLHIWWRHTLRVALEQALNAPIAVTPLNFKTEDPE